MILALMGRLFVLLLVVRNFLILVLLLPLGTISGVVQLHFLALRVYRWLLMYIDFYRIRIGLPLSIWLPARQYWGLNTFIHDEKGSWDLFQNWKTRVLRTCSLSDTTCRAPNPWFLVADTPGAWHARCRLEFVGHHRASKLLRTCRPMKVIIPNMHWNFILPKGLRSHSLYNSLF